ncbi:MAG TPA: LCCL domain-containing protein [Gemmataceae bacterium]|nr:LCCL domain-containing protein [Gemmataceae bacterium]
MNSATRSARTAKGLVLVLLPSLLAVPLSAAQPVSADDGPAKPGKTAGAAGFEARFTDNSSLKLTLRDERIELVSPYGKLSIPVAEVRQIDFRTRLSEDALRRIDAAVTHLGSQQYRQREEASAELLRLGAKAYPALQLAARSKDPEVARRAEAILDKIRETVSEEDLQVREYDVVETGHSRISGRIESATLKANTSQFGEVQLKLADVRSLRSLAAGPGGEVPTNVLPDPGNLVNYQNQIGQKFAFRVTGALVGNCWGSDVYTTDSTLAVAAVHAGVVRPGQTGVVKVMILASPPAFQGSTRNGVTTANYGAYRGAYQIIR